MYLLTIIIPAYNAEKFIGRTIEWAMRVKGKVEVIVVDDGSRDNTYELCKKMQDSYENLYVYTQNNAGVSAARNHGIRKSHGKWLFFCDSDDWVDAKNMSLLLEKAELMNVDVLLAAMNFVKPDPVGVVLHPVPNNQVIGTKEYLSSILFQGSSCNYLFKREVIEKYAIRFPEGIVNTEDQNFNIKYLACCKSVYSVNIPIYNYNHLNETSASHSNKSFKWKIGPLESVIDLMAFIEKQHVEKSVVEWQVNRLVEYFYKDHVAGAFSLQELDRVVNLLKMIGQDFPIICNSPKYKVVCLKPLLGIWLLKAYNKIKFGK